MAECHYVYIIQSRFDGIFYKGYTTDYHKRLISHNNGENRYTSKKTPWNLVYVELLPDKRSALIREKSLKRANQKYLKWLIEQESNQLNK